jgi:hypothetical protein
MDLKSATANPTVGDLGTLGTKLLPRHSHGPSRWIDRLHKTLFEISRLQEALFPAFLHSIEAPLSPFTFFIKQRFSPHSPQAMDAGNGAS